MHWRTGFGVDTSEPSLLPIGNLGIMSDWFRWRLYWGATKAGLDPDCISAVIDIESGFKADAVNPKYPSHGGLIQGSASKAQGLSAEEQLDAIVLPHFTKTVKSGETDCGTYYMATFLPAYMNAPDETLLGKKGGTEVLAGGLTTGALYKANPGFAPGYPKNPAEFFTVGDVKNLIRGRVNAVAQKAKARIPVPKEEPEKPVDTDYSLLITGLVVSAGLALAWWASKKR